MSFRAERTLGKLKLTFDPPPRALPATVMDKDINNGPPAIERDDSNPFMQAQCSAAVDQNTSSDAATEYHKTRGGGLSPDRLQFSHTGNHVVKAVFLGRFLCERVNGQSILCL